MGVGGVGRREGPLCGGGLRAEAGRGWSSGRCDQEECSGWWEQLVQRPWGGARLPLPGEASVAWRESAAGGREGGELVGWGGGPCSPARLTPDLRCQLALLCRSWKSPEGRPTSAPSPVGF